MCWVNEAVGGSFSFSSVNGQAPCAAPSKFFRSIRQGMVRHAKIGRRQGSRVGLVVSAMITVTTMLAKVLFIPSLHRVSRIGSSSSGALTISEDGNASPMSG